MVERERNPIASSWSMGRPRPQGRICHRCRLVFPAGVEARWHGRPAFLCDLCADWLGTGEYMEHVERVRPWCIADWPGSGPRPVRPVPCGSAGCPDGQARRRA
jgi:hypothetical protein